MSNWAFLNQHRVRQGHYASTEADGFNGAFLFKLMGAHLKTIASDGMGWQHVSVSLEKFPSATPPWGLMCAVKELFWEPNDWVVQYHPGQDDYVNTHPGCLHLWRPIHIELPKPPKICV